jgi:hypothetical protein
MIAAPAAMNAHGAPGPHHAQEQHPVLQLPGDGEEGEDDGPDEDVVHGQGLLDQVAGEVLLAELCPVGPPDPGAEADADRDPHRGPQRRLADADHVRVAVGEQVDGEHGDDAAQHGEPQPQGDVHDDEEPSGRW